MSIPGKFVNVFNRDDVTIPGHDLDLHYHRNNAKCLQSGRIVCVSKKEDAEIVGKYHLTKDKKLVDIQNNQEYTETSYYVIQINNEKNLLYENFDYFQQAADLLRKTNRGDTAEIMDGLTTIVKGYGDVSVMQRIEDLVLDDDEESKKKIKALYKTMCADTKRIFQPRIKELLS